MDKIKQIKSLNYLQKHELLNLSGGSLPNPFKISWLLDWFKASSEGSIEIIEPEGQENTFEFGGGSFGGGGSGGSW